MGECQGPWGVCESPSELDIPRGVGIFNLMSNRLSTDLFNLWKLCLWFGFLIRNVGNMVVCACLSVFRLL